MLNSKNSNWCFKHLWPLPRSRNRQGWEEKAGPRGWRRGGRRRRRRLEKQSWDRASTVFPFSPPDPGVCPPTACTEFVIPPSCSKLFLLGQDCTGRVGQVELHCHRAPSPPHGTESHPTTLHLSPPAPSFSGIPALSIPQFHCRPLVMYLVWGLWDWYLVFGSVLLIFCLMIFFVCLLFLLSFFPLFLFFFPQ